MGDPTPHIDIRISSQEPDGARWTASCSACGSELHKDVRDDELLSTLEVAVRHLCT